MFYAISSNDFFELLDFEMVLDPETIVNIVQQGPMYHSLFLPIVTSYITVVKYQNQEIDTGVIQRPYSGLTSLHALTHVCVCVFSPMQFYHMYRLI